MVLLATVHWGTWPIKPIHFRNNFGRLEPSERWPLDTRVVTLKCSLWPASTRELWPTKPVHFLYSFRPIRA